MAAPRKKKSGLGLIIAILVFFVFAGGGGAAAAYFLYWLPSQETADADEAIAAAEAAAAEATEAAEAAAQEATDQAGDALAQAGEAVPAEGTEGESAPAGEAPPGEDVPAGEEPPAGEEAPPAEEPPPAEEAPPVEEAPPAEEAVPPDEPREEGSSPGRRRGRGRAGYEQRARAVVRSAARQCFVQSQAHGQVTVQVSVAHDGRIATSRVLNNGTGNQTVARCISGALVGQRIGSSGPPNGATLDIMFEG